MLALEPVIRLAALAAVLVAMALLERAVPRRPLRVVLVMPDMHRIHHSEIRAELHSEPGFCLSVRDRVFGTCRAAPARGQLGMVIGVAGLRADPEQRIDRLLLQPLRE